jgi:cytidylate kinase
MEDSLLNYLNNRLGKKNENYSPEDTLPGPVITISREVGCAGLKIAKKLAGKLNETSGKRKWKVFSKEIFEETARELEMDHQKLKKILKTEKRNTFDEILAALGDKRFKSDRRIRKTVIDAIRTIAVDGYCIIVGRGGHLISRDIKNSLHLRFSAPPGWRIEKIAKRDKIPEADAKEFINKTEKERESVRKNISHNISDDGHYDMEINVSAFAMNKLIELLEIAVRIKGLVKP